VASQLTRIDGPRYVQLSPLVTDGNGQLARERTLIKTFILGVILGLGLAAAALYFVPAVDQGRERSIISVQANGGNREVFHVNLPGDRILVGRSGEQQTFPAGIVWPDSDLLADTQAELFKVRNDAERVVGVASRIAAGGDRPFIEWALHMPARGTMYALFDSAPTDSGVRMGSLRTGTREFEELRGGIVERYVTDIADGDESMTARLELVTALVGPDVPFTLIGEDEAFGGGEE